MSCFKPDGNVEEGGVIRPACVVYMMDADLDASKGKYQEGCRSCANDCW